jgi:hypothetical protein
VYQFVQGWHVQGQQAGHRLLRTRHRESRRGAPGAAGALDSPFLALHIAGAAAGDRRRAADDWRAVGRLGWQAATGRRRTHTSGVAPYGLFLSRLYTADAASCSSGYMVLMAVHMV